MVLNKRKNGREIKDYDNFDVSELIETDKELSFEDIGIKLPDAPPTQVVSIRLPTVLLNELKAIGSQEDIPYQALIKLFLSEAVKKKKLA